jgi:hypothetical protein
MTEKGMPDSPHWKIDRRVPVGLIIALAFQACAFVWWGAQLNDRVQDSERRIMAIESFDTQINTSQGAISERLARLEEKSSAQLTSSQHIESMMENLTRRSK